MLKSLKDLNFTNVANNKTLWSGHGPNFLSCEVDHYKVFDFSNLRRLRRRRALRRELAACSENSRLVSSLTYSDTGGSGHSQRRITETQHHHL